MTDEELLNCVRAGDREAFCRLVDKYAKPLTMMILRMVKDREDARDISQHVFLRAYERLPHLLNPSSFKTWLYKMAVNAVRDHLRKPRRTFVPDVLDGLADPSDSAACLLEKEHDKRRIRAAIQDLPLKQRMTLQLRVFEGLDYEQIAQILGGRANGAKGNFFHAVKSLKQKLDTKK